MGEIRLSSGQYLRPGAYIGFVFQARPMSSSGLPRLPGFVARGSRLARTGDFPITRSKVQEQSLTFASLPPHTATLPVNALALNDKTLARLYTGEGSAVDSRYWRFTESDPGVSGYDLVEIEITRFDKNATYLIDYQSSSRDRRDEIDISEMRTVLFVGDSEGSSLYEENLDFRIVTQVVGDSAGGDADALIPDADNSDGTGVASAAITKTTPGGSTGLVSFTTTPPTYTYPYPLSYSLQCTAVTLVPDTATFLLTITPLGGGNSLDFPIPPHPDSNWTFSFTITDGVNNTNYQLDGNYPFADGLRLDFTFGVGPAYFIANATPALADVFTWDTYGAQLIEIASPYANTNQFSTVTEPEDFGNNPGSTTNTSSGNITTNVDTDYDSLYNRNYYFEVESVTAPAFPLPRTAVILWSGWGEDPWSYGTINIDEGNLSSLTKASMENGIYLDFDFGVRHLLADAGNTLVSPVATNLASAIVLATEIRTNHNSHDSNGLIAAHQAAFLSGHLITAAVPTNEASLVLFCQDAQTVLTAHLADAQEHDVADTVYTLDPDINPTDLQTCVNFLNDYFTKFNRHIIGLNYVPGDSWQSDAKAPFMAYTAKDDRDYTLTVTTVTPGTSMALQWRTDQWEGGWGNATVTNANLYITLADGITLAVRNWDPAGVLVQYDAADIFEFTTVNLNLIDWSLRTRVTESIPEANIRQDPFGRITFVPLAYYVTLTETPDTVVSVKDAETGASISYTWIHDSAGQPQPVIMFVTDPATNLQVNYEYRGNEPDPGQTYYMTMYRLRLEEEYDLPVFYSTRDAANVGLRPVETTNDAWIMSDVAFDTDFFGCYVTQVMSSTADEVFSDADYRRAIDATEGQKSITDIIVNNRFSMLGYSKLSVERMSSPFVGGERLLWQGMPIGSPIGDAETPGTIVYTAKSSLQVFGSGSGRGRSILLGNTWANRQIILEDETPATVELDGSFIAGYSASRQAAFSSPVETLLRKDCASFTDMHIYDDNDLDTLGAAGVLFLYDVGDGLFRYGESHTVDQGSPDVNEISAMTQKDYVTRRVRNKLDINLVGLVPPSPAAGVIQIQSYLVEELANIVSENLVAPYGSENNPPTVRDIEPDTDTFVYVDERDRRRYHLGYWFNILYPIKWIMGLYSVDSRFWDNRSLSSAS